MTDPVPANVSKADLWRKRQLALPTNIEIPSLQAQNLKWKKANEIEASINELYQYAETSARASIDWYGRQKNNLAKWSQRLRALTIILTSTGGLIPIVSALGLSTVKLPGVDLNLGQLGDRKSTRLNSSHIQKSRMPSSA